MWKRHPEVLVVGAGPVGLYTALCLAERQHDVSVIDAELGPGARSYALALHARTIDAFTQMGLMQTLRERGLPVRRVGLYEGHERRAEMGTTDFASDDPLLFVVPQDELEEVLAQALADRGVRVRWNHRLRDLEPGFDRVRFSVDELEKQSGGYPIATSEWVVNAVREGDAAFVVGADGHRSTVRRRLEIPHDVVGPAATFAVFEVLTERPVPQEVRVVLDAHGTSVCWPLGERRCRWSFEVERADAPAEEARQKARLAVPEDDEAFADTDTSALDRLLGERAPWFDAGVSDLEWSTAVRFQPRLAEHFVKGRVLLVGDAAHVTAPAGIQSMNVGFAEATELVRHLSGVLRGEQGLDALDAWESSARAQWRTLLGIEGGLVPTARARPWVAEHARPLLSAIPASGTDLAALAAQVGLELR
jgi:2-polyprenyl-6-methoxyphenol hydroxylase-like FAD-dependent oxidoreductase